MGFIKPLKGGTAGMSCELTSLSCELMFKEKYKKLNNIELKLCI
jgi:hypothetical protein